MLSFFARWNLLYVTGILLIASFALNVGTIKENHSNVFYLLPGRLWELLVGCGVAINQFRRPTQRASTKPIIGVFISLISLSALFMGAAFFNKHSIFPDWRALVPTIASMLFILSGPHAWFNRIILSNPLLIGIGLISYPLYLWHWPILSVARIIQETHQLESGFAIGLLFLSGALAFLTRKWIELPAQNFLNFKSEKGIRSPGVNMTINRTKISWF
jgi:peptidoglycan/LPS O-acetylase OafA/YrhL